MWFYTFWTIIRFHISKNSIICCSIIPHIKELQVACTDTKVPFERLVTSCVAHHTLYKGGRRKTTEKAGAADLFLGKERETANQSFIPVSKLASPRRAGQISANLFPT